MADVWQTIEQAGVTLGLSVRTVNRHITAGKLASRLFEGRREVLINGSILGDFEEVACRPATPSSSDPNFTLRSESSGSVSERTAAGTTGSPPNPSIAAGNGEGRSWAGADGSLAGDGSRLDPHRQRVTPGVASERPWDVQTMLALTDSIDDKATLAVAAYQTLARSAETQVQSLRKVAFGAWAVVGVMAVGITIAVGWAAVAITSAEKSAGYLKEQLDKATARTQELERNARDDLAALRGQVGTRAESQDDLRKIQELTERAVLAARQAEAAGRPVGGIYPVGSVPFTGSSAGPAGAASPPSTQPVRNGPMPASRATLAGSRPSTYPAGRSAPYQNPNPPYLTNSNPAFDSK